MTGWWGENKYFRLCYRGFMPQVRKEIKRGPFLGHLYLIWDNVFNNSTFFSNIEKQISKGWCFNVRE